MQDDDCDVIPRKILLKRQVAIYDDEDLEAFFGKSQQVTVFDCRPSHLGDGLDLMPCNIFRQPTVNAFIKQYLHDAAATIRSLASSRKATTCSRLTVGNPSRKSSMVSPPS